MVIVRRQTYIVLTLLWALFILILCMLPGSKLPQSPIWQFDKVVHFSFYFILNYLSNSGANSMHSLPKLSLILLACIAYGIGIECLQGAFISDRFFEWNDVLSNTLGAICATVFLRYKASAKNY